MDYQFLSFFPFYSYNILKAWMQGESDKPLGAEKHLFAGTVAGKS